MTPLDKQKAFHKELKELLDKYNAEMMLEDFGHGYMQDYKIVIDFEYDESFFKDHKTGIIPQLIIDTY